jgi:hypothetical protein
MMDKMLSKILNVFYDRGSFTVVFKNGTRKECKAMFELDILLEQDAMLGFPELIGTFDCFVNNQPEQFGINSIERIIKKRN